MTSRLVKKNILDVAITDATSEEILEYVVSVAGTHKGKCSIITPNPEIIVYAREHPRALRIINEADISVCDGVGLYIAAELLGTPLKERVPGVDLMKSLCEKAAKGGLTTGFLGGKAGVADKTSKCLREMYPGLRVHFTGDEWDVKRFPKQGVDILFVAYGFPKQEEWIHTNLPILPVHVAMAVGGAFDYLSGGVIRAPFFVRSLGLEWLFRLIRQPWRIKRQVKLLTFIWLVMKALTHKNQTGKTSEVSSG